MGNILWLASYPKSGNTWLRAFIANAIADEREPLPLDRLAEFVDDEALPEHFAAVAGRSHRELEVGEIAATRPRVHTLLAQRSPRTLMVKSHNMAGTFDGYPLHEPSVTVGAIYVLRNPLDVVPSMADHFGLSLDEAIDFLGAEGAATENNDQFVTQMLGSWSEHVATWTAQDPQAVLVLRYEDMLSQPLKAFAKVMKKLGLGKDKALLKRAVKASSFRELAGQERRSGFVERSDKAERFFRAGKAGGWRAVLSDEQVDRVVADHGELMQRYGYLPKGR